jgi:hypothetical protein
MSLTTDVQRLSGADSVRTEYDTGMVSSTLPIAASICGASRTGTFMALPLFTDGQGWH